jgi:hypothetical protein
MAFEMATLCLSHRKNEKYGLKKYVKSIRIKDKTTSNENFINEVQ